MSRVRFFNDESNCICLCGLKFPKEKTDDKCPNHLNNWELWLEKRKRVHKVLGKLGREPGELLMNIGEEYKSVKEEKLLLGYTQIETHFDKLRGNPAFWKLPCSLGARGNSNKITEYFALKTKEENNEIPTIEYAGTSDYILKEKGILPRTRNLYTLWRKNNVYRQQIMERMTSKILKIEPHKPELQSLILIGEKIKLDLQTEIPLSPVVSKSETQSFLINNTSSTNCIDDSERSNRLSLKVANITFNQYDSSYSHKKISLIFESFMDSTVPCQQSILLENTGQVVLRLYWNQYHRLKIFREYCTDSKIFHPFKFNRNEILLLPGEKHDLSIEFKTNKPGNYFEYWELSTLPKIWNQDYQLVIVFKGFAFMKNFEEKAGTLIKDLNQRVRNTVIKDLLADIISKGTYSTETATHSYEVFEKELFESINLKENIFLRTPKYAYNKQLITELNELYQEVKQPSDDEIWNLSIRKLKETCRTKDLLTYFDNTMTAYDTAKTKRSLLRDNVIEGQNIKEFKVDKPIAGKPIGKTRKDLPTNIVDLESSTLTVSYYHRLTDIIQKLEKPSIRVNPDRTRYFYSYMIIRTYMYKMFDHLYLLDEERGLLENGDNTQDLPHKEISNTDYSKDETKKSQNITITLQNKKIHCFSERLFYELFEEGYISRTKRILSEAACGVAKPKSVLIRGISMSDAKKICKVYFNKDEMNEKGQKKKGQPEDNASKKPMLTKKLEIKKNLNQTEQDLLMNIIEDFDPFIEKLPEELETDISSTQFDLKIKGANEIENYEEKYLFVYTSLCNAIDDLVETTEGFKNPSLSIDTLNELRKCFTLPNILKADDGLPQSNTVISTRESLAEKRQSVSKDEYFKFLVETHWENNMKTKKYFIRERQQSIRNIQKQETYKTEDLVKTPSNIFSTETFRRKSEPPGIKDKEMQTMDIKKISRLNNEPEPSIQKASIIETTSSRNIFYFLDNCEQEDE